MATLSELIELENELHSAEIALNTVQAPSISYEDIEDVSDRYQDRLEYNWWVEEQKGLIQELKQAIGICRQGIDKESLEAHDAWSSIPEDTGFAGYHTADGRHTWDFEESIGE
jgi:hypothetical protein